ncbi:hypothetical protein ACP70R_006841 [Stipagrostis hirtigluma subsp. patula]
MTGGRSAWFQVEIRWAPTGGGAFQIWKCFFSEVI